MTLEQVLQDLTEIEKIVDPAKCNILSSYLSGFITDFEDKLHESNLEISNLWLKLRENEKSDTKTDRVIEITPEYQAREKLKLQISQLKRLRSDIKGRYEVLCNIKRHY